MKLIPLTKGYEAMVDDEDYNKVAMRTWCANPNYKTVYAQHHFRIKGGGKKMIYLHRFVIDAPQGIMVDHIDRNGLNCQKSNLRLVTPQQQNFNRQFTLKSDRKYRGVYKTKHGKWRASIGYNYKFYRLGIFNSEEEAARAYDEAAMKFHGEFAMLNFPMEAELLQNK